MHAKYDYVVVGVGGIGSAAVYWLTRLAPKGRLSDAFQSQRTNRLCNSGLGTIRIESFTRRFARSLAHHVSLSRVDNEQSYCRRKTMGYTNTDVYRSIAQHEYEPYDLRFPKKRSNEPHCRWEELQRDSGVQVIHKCGGLNFADKTCGEVHMH